MKRKDYLDGRQRGGAGSTLSNGERGQPSRLGKTPEGRTNESQASLSARSWRWMMWDGLPYPPETFSWTAWRSGLARSRSSDPIGERRSLPPTGV